MWGKDACVCTELIEVMPSGVAVGLSNRLINLQPLFECDDEWRDAL